MSIKDWRDSELIMTLSAEKELLDQLKKAMPLLKEAKLNKAVDAMMTVLEQVTANVQRAQREYDRRNRGPKNMVNAFRL